MGYEGLTRPNDFMLGYKPFSNVIYDESITPLEMLNKLAYKLNEIVASDTNVKDNVDKLLGVWKDAFMAKAGYVEPLETVYSANALNPTMELTNSTEVFKHKSERNHYIVKAEDRYKPLHLHMTETHPVDWKVFKKTDGQWVEFFSVTHATDLNADIYLATSGNSWEYKVQAQDEKYTVNRNFKLSWSFGVLQSIDNITCNQSGIQEQLFSDCHYEAECTYDYTTVVNEPTPLKWFFNYCYTEDDTYDMEHVEIGEGNSLDVNLNEIEAESEIYTMDNWQMQSQMWSDYLCGVLNPYTNNGFTFENQTIFRIVAECGDLTCTFSIKEVTIAGTKNPVIQLPDFGNVLLQDVLYSLNAPIYSGTYMYMKDTVGFTVSNFKKECYYIIKGFGNIHFRWWQKGSDGYYSFNYTDYYIPGTVSSQSAVMMFFYFNSWLRVGARITGFLINDDPPESEE